MYAFIFHQVLILGRYAMLSWRLSLSVGGSVSILRYKIFKFGIAPLLVFWNIYELSKQSLLKITFNFCQLGDIIIIIQQKINNSLTTCIQVI